MSIIEKIRKARESTVEVDGHTFSYRRPTDIQAQGMSYDSLQDAVKDVAGFYFDWDMTELDLIPGGTGESVPFDSELFWEWVQDNPKYWEKLVKAVLDSYKEYCKKRDDSGNS